MQASTKVKSVAGIFSVLIISVFIAAQAAAQSNQTVQPEITAEKSQLDEHSPLPENEIPEGLVLIPQVLTPLPENEMIGEPTPIPQDPTPLPDDEIVEDLTPIIPELTPLPENEIIGEPTPIPQELTPLPNDEIVEGPFPIEQLPQ